eukprot:GHVP01065466.1.p1 GENE.GHVP01065466.1~~GHVP01065466.1.p1  ORF type:complete len:138 (+),score=22.25 GHVP01065466.1:145-558(+)
MEFFLKDFTDDVSVTPNTVIPIHDNFESADEFWLKTQSSKIQFADYPRQQYHMKECENSTATDSDLDSDTALHQILDEITKPTKASKEAPAPDAPKKVTAEPKHYEIACGACYAFVDGFLKIAHFIAMVGWEVASNQ